MSEPVYRLSNAEREVILNWTGEDTEIHITAEIPAFRRLLERRGYRAGPDGFYRIPVSALTIRSVKACQDRVLSEKQRTAAANLVARNRARLQTPPGQG